MKLDNIFIHKNNCLNKISFVLHQLQYHFEYHNCLNIKRLSFIIKFAFRKYRKLYLKL